MRSASRTISKLRHATAVAVGGRALLIIGPSGAGKSALAMEMLGLGAELIADDQVMLTKEGDVLWASAPAAAPPLIEARGLGLIDVQRLAPPAPVVLILDLDATESERLPKARFASLLGVTIRNLRRPEHMSAAALVVALRAGGLVDPDRM